MNLRIILCFFKMKFLYRIGSWYFWVSWSSRPKCSKNHFLPFNFEFEATKDGAHTWKGNVKYVQFIINAKSESDQHTKHFQEALLSVCFFGTSRPSPDKAFSGLHFMYFKRLMQVVFLLPDRDYVFPSNSFK